MRVKNLQQRLRNMIDIALMLLVLIIIGLTLYNSMSHAEENVANLNNSDKALSTSPTPEETSVPNKNPIIAKLKQFKRECVHPEVEQTKEKYDGTLKLCLFVLDDGHVYLAHHGRVGPERVELDNIGTHMEASIDPRDVGYIRYIAFQDDTNFAFLLYSLVTRLNVAEE